MTAESAVLLVIAIVGCVLGVVGWVHKREDNVEENARWQGMVDGKLDAILGIGNRVTNLEESYINIKNDLAFVERTAKRAHERLDDLAEEVNRHND